MSSSTSIPTPKEVIEKIPSAAEVQDKIPSAAELKDDVVVASKKSLSSLRDFAAGGVGGVFAVLVGHPFDLVKVRMQTAEKGVYTGAMDVVRKTIAKEGMARVSWLDGQ
jgi:solute carrier family 25 carnitine/acylcarnitine transporter 20/29